MPNGYMLIRHSIRQQIGEFADSTIKFDWEWLTFNKNSNWV